MLVTINHPSLDGNEKTYLSSQATAGSPTLTVQDNTNFAQNDFVVIGVPGTKRTELLKVSSVTAGATITLTTNLVYDHPSNTPITLIRYDKVKVYSATTEAGSYSAISGSPFAINIDQPNTVISDSAGASTTWYKTSYFNSQTSVESGFSALMQGSGPKRGAVRQLIDTVRTDMGIKNDTNSVTDDEIIAWFNEGLSDIQGQKNWPQIETSTTTHTVASQNNYDVPTDTISVKRVKVTVGSTNFYPYYLPFQEFADLDTVTPVPSSDATEYYTIWGNEILLRPAPATSDLDMVIYYFKQMAVLDDDNDVPEITQPELLVFYANMMFSSKKKDWDSVSYWKKMYDTKLKQMLANSGGLKQQEKFSKVNTRLGSSNANDRFRIIAGTPS